MHEVKVSPDYPSDDDSRETSSTES